MSWMLFSILAALSWAVTNLIDKYVLTKLVKKPIIPVIVLGILGLITGIVIYFVQGFSQLSFWNIIIALLAGAFYTLAIMFYFRAVKIEEVSRVIPLWYLSPLFVSVLAAIFLKEVMTPLVYLGIFLIVGGSILIGSKKFTKPRLSVAFWIMLFASLTLAIEVILTKYLLNFSDFWTIFAYIRIGTAISSIPLFYFNFKDFAAIVKEKRKKPLLLISVSEALNLLGLLFFTIAISTGYASLVNAISSVQPFFVLIFTIFFSISNPSILKEEIGKSTIILKIVATLLMFIGIVLVVR